MPKIYTLKQKLDVKQEIERLHKQSGLSAAAFSERVGFTNPSVLSQLYNRPDLIGEKAMETALKYIARKQKYVGVVTDNYNKCFTTLESAYQLKNLGVIIGNGGYGKSFAIERYRDEKEKGGKVHVYTVNLEGVHTQKSCVRTIIEAVGIPTRERATVKQLIALLKDFLTARDCMLVLDEASALKGDKATVFKDIITALQGVCGLVLAGTPYLVENITKHALKGAHLFSELADRLPLVITILAEPTDEDAEAVFRANGCDDAQVEALMGRAGKEYKWMHWRNKPTYRGIYDCVSLTMLEKAAPKIEKPLYEPIA